MANTASDDCAVDPANALIKEIQAQNNSMMEQLNLLNEVTNNVNGLVQASQEARARLVADNLWLAHLRDGLAAACGPDYSAPGRQQPGEDPRPEALRGAMYDNDFWVLRMAVQGLASECNVLGDPARLASIAQPSAVDAQLHRAMVALSVLDGSVLNGGWQWESCD
mmetsp:Transcript_23740/g.74734  ORF Transcript_23740/g.74734 Transcript_23740/m.74734 type:complete len:166 (+) Transcript_23740:77-574(+)